MRTMTEWLAGSDGRPEKVHAAWRKEGVALLAIGGRFDVVRLPEPLVQAAVGTVGLGHSHTDFALGERLDGPVIHDGHGRNYYPLVPPGTVHEWRSPAPGVECLGRGTHVGIPAPDLFAYDPTHPVYWAAVGPMSGYCDPSSVALLVRVGAARLAEAEAAVVSAQEAR